MQFPNVYKIEYDFQIEKLLEDYNKRIKKGMAYRYLAGENYEDREVEEADANYSKTTVVKVKNGIAHKIAKEFVEKHHGKEFICHYISYGSDDFVEWHTDKRPAEYCENASRVNVFLTGESHTTFRDGDHKYKSAVVNVMGAEHKYDNRGKGHRVMFQIGIKGVNHDQFCQNILQRSTLEWLAF